MLVTKKPETYEAIQFTGDNLNLIEISKMLNISIYKIINGDEVSYSFISGHEYFLNNGNWIVLTKDTKEPIKVYSESKFNQLYQECK